MAEANRELFGAGPVLPVRGIKAAVDFYRERLGFSPDALWGDPPTHGSVTRGRVGIQFTQAPAGYRAGDYPGWTYIWVTDVDGLFAEFRARGVTISREPRDHEHGMREFEIEDPDGHRLRFGQYLDS